MTRRSLSVTPYMAPLLAALALAALLAEPTRAQYGPLTGGLTLPWENNRARVTELSVAPSASLPAGGNRVLVYLTADPDGKMPAEAVWQGADGGALQNRGPARLDGISIELKDAPPASGPTPPEALDEEYGVEVTTLIDNPRVLVTKQRYDPLAYAGPLHFHRDDVLVVYLRGGYTWPASAFWGAARVRRGDVDVIPANTLHRLANAGSDPLELLVVIPR
jgi:quercetin dioxygenase-like cupin family protein